MDLFNQILCRFQKCKRKVPPPSLDEKKNHLKVHVYGSKKKFQESFFSVIQAKVVQFFTYWNQNFSERKFSEIVKFFF